MMKKHLLLSDVAKLLKLKPYQIVYSLVVGHVPEPELRISNKRIFQECDLQRLAQHFGVSLEEKEDQLKGGRDE